MSYRNSKRIFIPVLLGIILTSSATSSLGTIAADSRELSFYHTHTGKRLNVVFWQDGEFVESALDDVNRFLSDFRTGDIVDIDPTLLDLIYDVRETLGSDGTFQTIQGDGSLIVLRHFEVATTMISDHPCIKYKENLQLLLERLESK